MHFRPTPRQLKNKTGTIASHATPADNGEFGVDFGPMASFAHPT
jgi:hypothetical protein